MYRIRGGKWRGTSGKASVKSRLSHDKRQTGSVRRSQELQWVLSINLLGLPSYISSHWNMRRRGLQGGWEGISTCRGKSGWGIRKGRWQRRVSTECLLWPEGNPQHGLHGRQEEKEFRVHEERFSRQGVWRTKPLCTVQVPLPKEQGEFCSLCSKMKMFGKYFGYM